MPRRVNSFNNQTITELQSNSTFLWSCDVCGKTYEKERDAKLCEIICLKIQKGWGSDRGRI